MILPLKTRGVNKLTPGVGVIFIGFWPFFKKGSPTPQDIDLLDTQKGAF